MEYIYKKVVFLLITFLFPVIAYTQSGTIAGKVTETGTNEPLIGATVSIQGTTLGATVDMDGNYRILNVPPGLYVLEARFLGFATVVVEEVVVRTDLTTTQDFQLREEIFQGEEITVVAERPVIIRDLTSSESRVSSEEIKKLPVQEIGDIIRLQAGVNIGDDGQLHIRGGRSSEVSYVVDGIRVSDDFDRSQGLRIENESIEELQVITGAFNAEHGQAMSGIINVATKSGTNRFEATGRAWSGSYLVSNSNLYDGLSTGFSDLNPARMYNASASVSGPIIKDKLTFFITGRIFENEGWLTGRNAFSPQGAFSENIPIDTDFNEFRTIYGQRVNLNDPWISLDTLDAQTLVLSDSGRRDSSLVNMNKFNSYSTQGNIQVRPTSYLRFNLIGSYGFEEGGSFSQQRRLVPLGLSSFERENYSVNLKTTITPSTNTFLTLNTATTRNQFKNRLFDDPFDPRFFNFNNIDVRDPNENPRFQNKQPGQQFQFDQVGTDNNFFSRSTQTFIGKAEISSQISHRHFIKAGVNVQADVVKFNSFNLQPFSDDPTRINGPGGRLLSELTPEERRIIELGIPSLETANNSRFTRKPVNFSAYIQDKIDFDDFIINIGLRYDLFQPNALIPADPMDPDITNPTLQANREFTREEREEFWWKKASAKSQLSPRLGVSYSFSDRGLVFFSYGYFFQMPAYSFLFENSQILLEESSGVFGIFGNPDLKPEKTIQYEIGFKYEIFDGTALETTAFYRDSRDFVSSGEIERTHIPAVNYATWINRDFANTKGITVALNQSLGRQVSFGVDYTYTLAEGSNSDPAAEFNLAVSRNDLTGQSLTKFVQLLDWDRSHILNTRFFFAGKDWGANFVGRLLTGTPFTPSTPFTARTGPTASVRDLRNTQRQPTNFTIDLNAFKDFRFRGANFQVFLNLFNILDSEVVNSVFADSGSPDRPLIIPGTFDEGFFNDPGRFGEPRRVQLGVQLSF
ncbi:MAG: TonB-dependent receptor domain-containing protein [Balneolaceae bacterium]